MKAKVKPWRGAPETVAKPGIGEAFTFALKRDDVYIRLEGGGESVFLFQAASLRGGTEVWVAPNLRDIVPLRLEKVLKDGTAVFAAAGKTGKGKGK